MRPSRILQYLVPLALAFVFASASSARAAGRSGSVEFGLDGRAALLMFDDPPYYQYYQNFGPQRFDNTFVIDLPVESIRAGYYVSDAFEIESTFGLSFATRDGNSTHFLRFGLDLLYNFGSSDRGSRPFLSVGGGLRSIENGGGRTQKHVNGGLGFRIPTGDRSALRLHSVVSRTFDNDNYSLDIGYWDVGLRFGYSVFTR